MRLQNIFLTAFLSLGAVLIPTIAQAQSVDSISLIRPHILAAQANDATKAQTKTIRIFCASTLFQEQELKSINPNDIEKIEVFRENTATAIYGGRGANGAILMTLKHPPTKPLR